MNTDQTFSLCMFCLQILMIFFSRNSSYKINGGVRLNIHYMASMATYQNVCPEVTQRPWSVMSPNAEGQEVMLYDIFKNKNLSINKNTFNS